jgi:single-stranded DNA-binding protein
MNSCYFLGKLPEDGVVSVYKCDNIDVAEFALEIESFRTSKSGKKSRTVNSLLFEAWHTAAISIKERLKPYSLILVECEARQGVGPNDETYFRVESFKIFNEG